MNLRRINNGQRIGRTDVEVLVGIEFARCGNSEFERLHRHDGIIGLTFLFQLLLFLHPLLHLLVLLFHSFGVRHLRHDLHRVSLHEEHSRRVGLQVAHLHMQGVLINQRRIAQPVGDGVAFRGSIDKERILLIEVQSANDRQLIVAITEVECEAVGLFSLRLDEETVGLRLRKGAEHDVVGQEMGVGHTQDIVDMKRVAPYGVLPRVGFRRRNDDAVVESNHLALLAELVVAVGIL